MRPQEMWGISTSGGLAMAFAGSTPIGVAIYADEESARPEAERAARQQRVIARPVRVWVQQWPSMMYRELTTEERSGPAEKCEYVVGA